MRALIREKIYHYYYPDFNFEESNFEEVPPFIRFHEVDLSYLFTGKESIEEKCLRLKNHLQSIKQHLKDSIVIFYFGIIDRDSSKPSKFQTILMGYNDRSKVLA